MTEIAIALVGIGIGFSIGWRARELYAQRIVNKYLADAEEQMNDPKNVMNIEVMKQQDSFYVYNTENGAFITQVKSKEELFKFFKEKHPEKNVMMKKEDFALFENV